ncbi:hypothetical protein GTA08_BOTSDO06401 [Neofusicoccum parvum]|nr:hypothetical protein GTA08_BOTSDO06401 [Neofusicoccum parvum]
MLDYRDALAIPLLLFYVPCFISSVVLIFRHGWWQSWWTWFVLSTFSITRVAYAALQLAAYTHPERHGFRVAAATFAVDGVSPLLFMSLGLVHRLRAIIWRIRPDVSRSTLLGTSFLRLLELLVTAAFICASVGYRGISRDEVEHGIAKHSSVLKAAAAMYLTTCAAIVLATADLSMHYRASIPRGEGKVLMVLVAGLPLLCIRTSYLAVDVLGDVARFSAISGNVTIFLCLALLPEIVMSVGHLVLGFLVRVISREEWKAMQQNHNGKERNEQEGSLNGILLDRPE